MEHSDNSCNFSINNDKNKYQFKEKRNILARTTSVVEKKIIEKTIVRKLYYIYKYYYWYF